MAANEAPPAAALLRDFVNTVDVESGTDALVDPPALGRWLRERGLQPAGTVPPSAEDLATAVRLREGLRAAMAGHHDDADGPQPDLDALSYGLVLRLAFDENRPRLVPLATGASGALAGVLVAVADAMADGSWDRLKACPAQTCRYAFYDGSRNRSRTWCAMGVCGNREKTRAYRARRRVRPDDREENHDR